MKELHFLFFGILLGWGAAIPIGPINLEIIRRHLHFGAIFGLALGLGACLADVTYLFVMILGAAAVLTHPLTLKMVAFLGSLVLLWFGVMAFRTSTNFMTSTPTQALLNSPGSNVLQGYFLTLLNPMTILFWSSVSSQISLFTLQHPHRGIYCGLGVLIGTISWILFLNTVLHSTRQFLSETAVHRLNQIGGLILIGFALFGILKVCFTA